jgi:ATP-dependent helicase/nuclease subunit B
MASKNTASQKPRPSAAPAPARVSVLLGPARSGKTERLLTRYRRALADGQPGCALWLAPHQRSAVDIRGRLLDDKLRGCFSPNVMTFAQFAETVLAMSAEPMRSLSGFMKRQLLGRLIEQAASEDQLQYFRPILDRPGLVELVGQFISELKRLEIWPEHFREVCERRGLEAKDRELLHLYESYQQRLLRHQLYDAEGRFWSARELLRQGQQRPWENLRLVVVDGFTDFTRTQHEILELLAERVDELHVSLPQEPDSQRAELFAKSRNTLEQLTARHARLETMWTARPEVAAWPALAHLESELFKNPREVRTAEKAGNIETLVAARSLGEVQNIGRTIKKLLREGDPESHTPVRPGDIAVVFRSLTEAAPLVRELFTELGLPFALETGEVLLQSRAVAAFLSFLELDRQDWPFRQLLAVNGNTFFDPDWSEWQTPGAASATERTIHDMQISSGRRELLTQLERKIRAAQAAEETPDPDLDQERLEVRRQRRDRAVQTLAVLRRLEACFSSLPQQASPGAWSEALGKFAEEIGLLRAIAAGDAASLPRDRAAWNRLVEVLASGDRLWQDLEEPAPALDLKQVVDLLLEIARTEEIPRERDETGCVRVLAAASARALSIPYLFFAGLSEKSFPPPEREDRLYSEAESQRLHAHGLPLVLRAERSQEEMLLFYEILTRATRRLYLSFPGLDEKAQPLLPSPYLAEVDRTFSSGVPRREFTDLSPLPKDDEVLSHGDQRVVAVHQALAGQCSLLAGMVQGSATHSVAANIQAGLNTTHERSSIETFSPWEGLLPGEAGRKLLADEFSADHAWSPSHLEQYAHCPHQFFLQRVLKLEPLTDLELEIDFLARGQLLHATLAKLHRQLNEQRGHATSPAAISDEEYEELANRVLAEVFRPRDGDYPLVQAFEEIDRRLIRRWLSEYRQQHTEYDSRFAGFDVPPTPGHFEVSFGTPRTTADPLSTTAAFSLTDSVKISGRIDRIDVGQLQGRSVFNILDYKTGSSQGYSKSAVRSGDALQLTLYAMAVESLLLKSQRALADRVGYWFVNDRGFTEALAMLDAAHGELRATDDWESLKQTLVARVEALVQAIRDGQFPVFSRDEYCTSRCDYSTVCRINQVRSLRKQWSAGQ